MQKSLCALFTVCLMFFLSSCRYEYDESYSAPEGKPIKSLLPNMEIVWNGTTSFEDYNVARSTIQNDLCTNVFKSNVGVKQGSIVVAIQSLKTETNWGWIGFGWMDMYLHTLYGVPFSSKTTTLILTFDICDKYGKAIERYTYQTENTYYIGVYYKKDSQISTSEACHDILKSFHKDISSDYQRIVRGLDTSIPIVSQESVKETASVIKERENNISITSTPQEQQTAETEINISSVDVDIPQTSVVNDNTFVVIIANEDYKRVAKVSNALNDGQVFSKYCHCTLGIPMQHIHYVENATLNEMRSELSWLKELSSAYEGEDKVIVYYAGHGVPNESTHESYLVPVDGQGGNTETCLALDEVYQKLGELNSQRVFVIIDACFSGSTRDGNMMDGVARGVAIKSKPNTPQGKMVVLSAAQGDETAYPLEEESHGLFTYYLLKKLQDSKGEVTLSELSNYISKNVRRQSIVINGKSQTPTISASTGINEEWQSWKLK